jgi:hypothetical protein
MPKTWVIIALMRLDFLSVVKLPALEKNHITFVNT